MKRSTRRKARDPVISLINIVFLILIFFMVAGSLSSKPDPALHFVQTNDLECCVAPDAIAIDRHGHFQVDGKTTLNITHVLGADTRPSQAVRLAPDRDLEAKTLLKRIELLRSHGAIEIVILTEHIEP